MTRQMVSSTTRVGFLVIVAGAMLFAAFTFLGGRFAKHGVRYFVLMPDAGGVVKGTRISMAGVHIGQVEDVDLLTAREVRVTISIDGKYHLPAGCVAEIPVQFISLGESGMVIVPPDIIAGDLAAGSTIEGRHPGPLDQMFPDSKTTIKTLNETMEALRDLLKDEDLKGNIKHLLASSAKTMEQFEKLAGSTNRLMATNQNSITVAVENARDAMIDVHKGADLITKLMKDGHYEDKIASLLKTFDATSAKVGKLVDNLNAYVSDPAMHDTLNTTMNNVKDLSEQGKIMATKMNIIIDNGTVVSGKAIALTDQATEVAAEAKNLVTKLEGLVDKVEGKIDSVKLPKSPIGPIHAEAREIRDTRPNYNRTDVNFSMPVFGQDIYFGLFDAFGSNKLNFQLGKPLGPNGEFRYGAYAGTEGIGVDYRIAPRLGIRTDVFNANKPRFDAMAQYDFGKGFSTWIGMDRIFDRNGFAIGIGIQK